MRAQLALLHAIGNPSKPLRHTVGTNVAVIVGVGGLPTWPELLSAIVQCLESNDPDSLEGALDALYKVSPGWLHLKFTGWQWHEQLKLCASRTVCCCQTTAVCLVWKRKIGTSDCSEAKRGERGRERERERE